MTKKKEVIGSRTRIKWAIQTYRNSSVTADSVKVIKEIQIMETLHEIEYLFIENKVLIMTAAGCPETELRFEKVGSIV